jgi:hypothetical protein
MTTPAPPAIACRICHRLLNHNLDLRTGEIHYTHPAGRNPGSIDHEPDPVPADDVDARHVCDFCSSDHILYAYAVAPIQTLHTTPGEHLIQNYESDWAACPDCAALIETRNLPGLQDRVRRYGPPLDPPAVQALHTLQQAVLDNLRPGRTIATVGHWEPTPLPAPILPKIRDRLTRLLDGDDRLPGDLDHPQTRHHLTAGLQAAHLYWIDEQFTDLTRHAARDLPATAADTLTPPAPHGMVAWAQPVGPRADITAATWTTTGGGILMVTYRSVGTGLPAASLQQLREHVGWLTPQHHTHLQPGQTIDATDPAAATAVTWLLIGQKLAETRPAPLDKAVRKSYQRTGRPAPAVQLVRIRGTADTPAPASEAAGGGGISEHAYRWWVRGHWRRQAFGTGRQQRRLIYIDPQLRGPAGKPVKATTTVRVLGSRRPPGEPAQHPPADR